MGGLRAARVLDGARGRARGIGRRRGRWAGACRGSRAGTRRGEQAREQRQQQDKTYGTFHGIALLCSFSAASLCMTKE